MTILDKVINDRNGIYVHALELGSSYELECSIEALTSEFLNDGFSIEDVKEFFNTIELYYYKDDPSEECEAEEEELYNFDIDSFIDELN